LKSKIQDENREMGAGVKWRAKRTVGKIIMLKEFLPCNPSQPHQRTVTEDQNARFKPQM